MHVTGEEDPDDRPPFQWNRQALFMVVLTMVALALPLMSVVWFASDYLEAKRRVPVVEPGKGASTVEAENPALRSALERASEKMLPTEPITDERPSLMVRVAPADRGAKAQSLREAVTKAGGSLVELESGTRFLVSAPAGSAAAIRQALGTDARASSAIDSADIYEVRFQ
jgi:hypothetical protein